MTFPHFNRRLHLYMGMFLLPWFFMYGLSSIPFSHNTYFEERDKAKGIPLWTKRFEQAYDVPVPEDGNLKPLGDRIMRDTGMQGAYGTYRQGPNQVNVYVYTFWKSTQIKYFLAEKKLVAEDRRFRFEHFLTGMHAKGGFEQNGFFHDLWGVIVDVVVLAMLLWVATGIYMWWGLPGSRGWGWAALLGGLGSFGLFITRL